MYLFIYSIFIVHLLLNLFLRIYIYIYIINKCVGLQKHKAVCSKNTFERVFIHALLITKHYVKYTGQEAENKGGQESPKPEFLLIYFPQSHWAHVTLNQWRKKNTDMLGRIVTALVLTCPHKPAVIHQSVSKMQPLLPKDITIV